MGDDAGDVTTGDVTAMDGMDAAAESAADEMDAEPAAAAATADDTGAAGYDPAFEPTES